MSNICPDCKGTGYTDRDTGYSADPSKGGFIDAVECSCVEVELCPRCHSPMEHQTSEAPNNADSDAEWYRCLVCEYETEIN